LADARIGFAAGRIEYIDGIGGAATPRPRKTIAGHHHDWCACRKIEIARRGLIDLRDAPDADRLSLRSEMS
jgi:hypothetical protein